MKSSNKYEFRPSDVNLENGLMSTFGKCEIETAATHLIEYLRDECEDHWKSFHLFGLLVYYHNRGLNTDEALFGLMGPWLDDGPFRFQDAGFYIVNWGNGLQVTQDFLNRISKHVSYRQINTADVIPTIHESSS